MIQLADVGIGIEGKEGKQAALASDFSIVTFSDLNKLLLWHGLVKAGGVCGRKALGIGGLFLSL